MNLARDQNLTAVSPSGSPSGVIAKLACIKSSQTVCFWGRLSFTLRPVDTFVKPIFSGAERLKENSVVSCRIRIGPSVTLIRRAEAEEVTPTGFVFAHCRVGEETVSRFGVRPVLECRRQRFARSFSENLKHCPKPPIQTAAPKSHSAVSISAQFYLMRAPRSFGVTRGIIVA